VPGDSFGDGLAMGPGGFGSGPLGGDIHGGHGDQPQDAGEDHHHQDSNY
jgi:hypothetical protein